MIIHDNHQNFLQKSDLQLLITTLRLSPGQLSVTSSYKTNIHLNLIIDKKIFCYTNYTKNVTLIPVINNKHSKSHQSMKAHCGS